MFVQAERVKSLRDILTDQLVHSSAPSLALSLIISGKGLSTTL